MGRLKAWQDKMRRVGKAINEGKDPTDETYLEVDFRRLLLTVVGRTDALNGGVELKIQHDGVPHWHRDTSFSLPAKGELIEAKVGDTLRLVFAEDESS